jgi:zinc protease
MACVAFASTIWPVENSDLPPDPQLRRGVLPNGLRYAIRHNSEPRGRVSLRLLVAAGSLHEQDDERGLAHFVEHMVFRGTRQHPNGSMLAELQRLGMGVGPDTGAFTFYDHTTYHLELPDPGEPTLRHGLSIFREYAEEVTFAPELIERERGVILSEKAIRDTPDSRAWLTNLAFLWPDSRQVQRSPIGLEPSIRQFTRAQFIAFYDAWYRPERMAVIVVGDIAPDLAERLITDVFSSLASRGPAQTAPESCAPETASQPDIRVFTDPGVLGASCSLEHPFAEPRVADTHARRVQLLHRALAFAMFQRRATKAAAQADGRSLSPWAAVTANLPGWAVATFGATGRITNWRDFITDVEQEHRRAFLHGFTAEELRFAKTSFATSYADAVRTSATWPSGWLADQVTNSVMEGSVFSTPAAAQQDLAADLETATTAECLAEFRRVWSKRALHVFVATNPEFKVTGPEIADALNASRSTAVTAPAETAASTFAYTDFGPVGVTTSERHLADLDVHQAEFSNGVRLNFKATDFEADSLNVCVRVGRGKLSQPAGKPGLDLLANQMVPYGGLKRHPFNEIQDLLTGHTVTASFEVATDAFEFHARCARKDLLLCLQMITAHFTDSAYRPEARRQADAAFGSMYANLAASAGGPIAVHSQRILTGGDRRFGIAVPEELSARTLQELTNWIEPELKHGAIELSVVGDGAWEDARTAVAQTLAALPARKSPVRPPDASIRVGKPKKSMYVYTTPSQLKQVALEWFCPVTDLQGVHQERRCRLLADLIEERLRIRLRDELGAAYNCSAEFDQFDALPSYSYFAIYTEVAPEHAQQATRLVKDELDRLRKSKFTDDEFERVKRPFLRHRDEDLRSNVYWAYTVLRDAQEHPQRIDAARDRATDTAAITRSELEKLAKRYLDSKRCFQFVAYPTKAAGADFRFGR